nr:MAG TPA: hypothetical protein [Caudoviricetes sp.]
MFEKNTYYAIILDYIVQLINRKAKIPFIEGFLNG